MEIIESMYQLQENDGELRLHGLNLSLRTARRIFEKAATCAPVFLVRLLKNSMHL